MGNRNTAAGDKAYKGVRKNGGSKDSAKQASKQASENYWDGLKAEYKRRSKSNK